MKRNMVTAVASIFGSRVLAMIVMAVSTPLFVRLLGPDSYGVYATLMAVFGLFMILVSSGIDTGARKYIAEERGIDGWQMYVFGYYFRLAALLVVVAAGLLLLAARTGVVAVALGEKYTTYFYLLAALAIVAQFRAYVLGTLMGLKLEHVSEPLRVLKSLSFAVFSVGLLLLGYGVAGVLVGQILSSLLSILVAGAVIARHIPLVSVFKRTPSGFPTRELIDFNTLTIVIIFLLFSLRHVDVLMLEVFRESAQVGFYRSALVLAELLWLVPKSIQSVMIQSTSSLWESKDTERITEIASRSSRYALLFTGLLAVGLAGLAPQFVPIYYGEEFRPAVLPLLLLLPGTVGFAVARPMLAISQAKGDLKPLIAATGATAVINLGLNLLLIPTYGMVGAAIATSIGYGSLPIFHVIAARRLGYRPVDDIRLGRVALTMGGTAIPVFGLAQLIGDPLLAVIVVPPVGALTYAVLTVATGAMGLDELFELGDAFPSPIDEKVDALRTRVEQADGLLSFLAPTRN